LLLADHSKMIDIGALHGGSEFGSCTAQAFGQQAGQATIAGQ
jgi:hypothetical protein